jgi:hypothetical protein
MSWACNQNVAAQRLCRLRKDKTEIDALRRSAAVADAVSETIRTLGADAIERTEDDLAAAIRSRLHRWGGTRLSFDVVVASGPNAARPYYRHGDRRVQRGDSVVIDFGAFVDSYASYQTRTVVFAGEPPVRFEAAHEAVLTALEAGVDAVEPGGTAGEIDRIVASELNAAGSARTSSIRQATASASRHTRPHGLPPATTANSNLTWCSALSRASTSRTLRSRSVSASRTSSPLPTTAANGSTTRRERGTYWKTPENSDAAFVLPIRVVEQLPVRDERRRVPFVFVGSPDRRLVGLVNFPGQRQSSVVLAGDLSRVADVLVPDCEPA